MICGTDCDYSMVLSHGDPIIHHGTLEMPGLPLGFPTSPSDNKEPRGPVSFPMEHGSEDGED
jgi:hypothetical protein